MPTSADPPSNDVANNGKNIVVVMMLEMKINLFFQVKNNIFSRNKGMSYQKFKFSSLCDMVVFNLFFDFCSHILRK